MATGGGERRVQCQRTRTGGLKVSVREAGVHKVERSNVEERCDAVVEEVGDLLEAGLDPARVRVEIRKSVRVK